MNGRRVFLSLILFVSALAHGAASPQVEPGLASEEDKVQFLLYLQKNVPEVLNQAPRYGFSFMALLEDQSKLETLLAQEPQFQKLAPLRPPLLHLQAQPVTQGTFKGLRIKSEAVAQWRGKLLGAIDSLMQAEGGPGADAGFADAVLKRIAYLRKEIGPKGFNGALVGLIQSLPAESKAKIFKAPTAAEKVDLLKSGNVDPTALGRLKVLSEQEEELLKHEKEVLELFSEDVFRAPFGSEEAKLMRNIVDNRYKSAALAAAKEEIARFYELQSKKNAGCLFQTDALIRGLVR